MNPHRRWIIATSGVVWFLLANVFVFGLIQSIPPNVFTENTQLDALGDLLTLDGILFAFLGILASLDYQRLVGARDRAKQLATDATRLAEAERQSKGLTIVLRSDVAAVMLLVFSVILSIYFIARSDVQISPTTLGYPTLAALLALGLLLLRLFDSAYLQ